MRVCLFSPGPDWCTHGPFLLPSWWLWPWEHRPADLTYHQHLGQPHTQWNRSKIPATRTEKTHVHSAECSSVFGRSSTMLSDFVPLFQRVRRRLAGSFCLLRRWRPAQTHTLSKHCTQCQQNLILHNRQVETQVAPTLPFWLYCGAPPTTSTVKGLRKWPAPTE